jgi:hypothetical protein
MSTNQSKAEQRNSTTRAFGGYKHPHKRISDKEKELEERERALEERERSLTVVNTPNELPEPELTNESGRHKADKLKSSDSGAKAQHAKSSRKSSNDRPRGSKSGNRSMRAESPNRR